MTLPAKQSPFRVISSPQQWWLHLLHPAPVTLTVVAATIFALLVRKPDFPSLLRIDGSLLLSQLSVSIFNDLRDVEVDNRADPHRRPLTAVARRRLIGAVVVLLIAAIGLALSFGWLSALLVTLGSASGLAYSAWFKATPLSWVPFAVAFPVLPLWECVALGRNIPMLWSLILIGAPCAVSIHLADSIPDIEGDRIEGLTGLAVTLGLERSVRLTQALLLSGSVLCFLLSWMLQDPLIGVLAASIGISATVVTVIEKDSNHFFRYSIALGAAGLGAAWIGALAM